MIGKEKMSLNNWLCKHFDDEKKGYVTIGDIILIIISKVLCFILAIIIIVGVGYLIAEGVIFIQNGDFFNKEKTNLIGFFGVLILTGFIFGILFYFYSKISKIKVAKCPLKEQE